MASPALLALDAVSDAALYHDVTKWGFFSVLYAHGGQKHQRSHLLPDLPKVLTAFPANRDAWISQCEFMRPNRRAVNLARMGCVFVDLDCYKLGLDPWSTLDEMLRMLEEERYPLPSVVNFSGQGLQARWLHDYIPRQALPRWQLVQTALCDLLEQFGADRASKDASRVLRIVGTTNTKNGAMVQTAHITPENGQPIKYGFDWLTEFFLREGRWQSEARYRTECEASDHPYTDHQKASMVAARLKRKASGLRVVPGGRKTTQNGFSARQLAWDRLEDLRTLYKLRGTARGYSMPLLFWSLNFMLLSGATNVGNFWDEANELAREFTFGKLSRIDELSTLYAKGKQYAAGKTVRLGQKEWPALYTPKNSTLIDLFGITGDEERQLRTIVSVDEARRRDAAAARKRRQERGAMDRATYLTMHDDKRASARLMHAAGMRQRAIADQLGVSLGTVNGWVR